MKSFLWDIALHYICVSTAFALGSHVIDVDKGSPSNNTVHYSSVSKSTITNLTGPRVMDVYPHISDEGWERAVLEGCSLLGAAGTTEQQALSYFPAEQERGTIRSEYWTYPNDLQDWGYDAEDDGKDDLRSGHDLALHEAMNHFNIDFRFDFQGGPTYYDGWCHERTTVHDTATYLATYATFKTLVNFDHGVIVAWYKYGPKYMAEHLIINTPLPKLRRWSDIAFLGWLGLAWKHQKNFTNLKYIVSANVQNKETSQILQYILYVDDVEASCKDYDWINRKEWDMQTPQGKALVGSSNGRGAILILITHKNIFGETTTVDKVIFWCGKTEGRWEPNLMFFVKR